MTNLPGCSCTGIICDSCLNTFKEIGAVVELQRLIEIIQLQIAACHNDGEHQLARELESLIMVLEGEEQS